MWIKLRNFFGKLLLKIFLKPKKRKNLEKLGSKYGGWVVPVDLFNQSSICYCAGVGEDISFDLELIRRFLWQVYAFDPTPRAIKHVKKNTPKTLNYHFYDFGLWSSDIKMKFYTPKNPLHVSYSLLNLENTNGFFLKL